MRVVVPAACALVFAVAARPAAACVPIDDEITPYQTDPAYANDTTPPPAPQADFEVTRGKSGGGCTKTDCDGTYANIYVDIAAIDDQAPAERMGYILTVAGGDVPNDLYSRFMDGVPVFQPRGEFSYNFDYNDTDWDFDLEVRSIDLNGNISDPTLLHIGMHEGGGCSTSAQDSGWLLLPVLGFVLRRRKRC